MSIRLQDTYLESRVEAMQAERRDATKAKTLGSIVREYFATRDDAIPLRQRTDTIHQIPNGPVGHTGGGDSSGAMEK